MTAPEPFTWAPCTFPACEVELRVLADHYPNVAPTWRCLAHRHDREDADA